MIKSWILFLGLQVILFACVAGEVSHKQQTRERQIPASPLEIDLSNRQTLPPPTLAATLTTHSTLSQISPSPLPTASSTTIPVITLSVPDEWRVQTLVALKKLNQGNSRYSWQLVDGDQADVTLVKDDSGVIIREMVYSLAIPFTEEWEGVSLEQAEEILSQGHESITILPWSDMKPDQKALRIDGLSPHDSGYPFVDRWSLVADRPFKEATKDLASQLRESENDSIIHLAAVGDISLDRTLGEVLSRGDLQFPFSAVAEQLQEADISVGNFESALGESGIPQQKSYTFRAPPKAATSLALGGFDILSLANNHGMDYGEIALIEAISLLEQQGLSTVGAGENNALAYSPQIMEVNGLKTAFFGYANVPVEGGGFDVASWTAGIDKPGIAWAEPQIVANNITAIRDQVDLIVILLHSGIEYLPTPSETQKSIAHTAIDAGADLVIGHHAHILQGIEYYKDGVIIYGTGNFAFDINGPPESAIYHIWLDRDGVREIALDPVIVQPGGKPRLADNSEAKQIRKQVYQLTDQLNIQ
jgi:poly-gamma-glutamate capsule biosynthesis protein CapA/YwtB (metallophosphatase superfamily)